MPAIRVCIMGHSGVGKSMVGRLFSIPGWDPLRVRKPRDANDAKVCILPKDFKRERAKRQASQALHGPVANDLEVHPDCSFFTVRGKQQFLPHASDEFDAKDADTALRVEIFAPVLFDMCNLSQKLTNAGAFFIDPNEMLFLFLNPTAQPLISMPAPAPTEELRQATVFAVTERDRVQGNSPDLADALDRARKLDLEWNAWCGFINAFPQNCVDLTEWPHFEFRYYGRGGQEHARYELIRARDTLLSKVKKSHQGMAARLEPLLLRAGDIAQLTDIVSA